MADAIHFSEADTVENTDPPGQEGVGELPVRTLRNRTISCWQLAPQERQEVARTGLLWLTTQTFPPDVPLMPGQAERLQPVVSITGMKDWALQGRAWPPDPTAEEQLKKLRAELHATREELARLKAAGVSFGHNNPPEEYRLGLSEADIASGEGAIADAETQLEVAAAGQVPSAEAVGAARSSLLSLLLKALAWTGGRGQVLLDGALKAAGGEVVTNPGSLIAHLHALVGLLNSWAKAILRLP